MRHLERHTLRQKDEVRREISMECKSTKKQTSFHLDAKTTAYNHVLFLCEEHRPVPLADRDDPQKDLHLHTRHLISRLRVDIALKLLFYIIWMLFRPSVVEKAELRG
jgi:hypothetical protein